MNYDRIILELLERVSKLEEEVIQLKKNFASEENSDTSSFYYDKKKISTNSSRDTTKYILDGKKYGKNRLVLAIVKKYMTIHPETTAAMLTTIFDRSLQGSLGVVRLVDDVKSAYTDSDVRFFLKSDEIIRTSTENCAVCSQWGISNINNIIAKATELGIAITVIK